MIELVDSHPRTFQLCKSFSINHGDCYNDSFVNEGNIFHFHITVLSWEKLWSKKNPVKRRVGRVSLTIECRTRSTVHWFCSREFASRLNNWCKTKPNYTRLSQFPALRMGYLFEFSIPSFWLVKVEQIKDQYFYICTLWIRAASNPK